MDGYFCGSANRYFDRICNFALFDKHHLDILDTMEPWSQITVKRVELRNHSHPRCGWEWLMKTEQNERVIRACTRAGSIRKELSKRWEFIRKLLNNASGQVIGDSDSLILRVGVRFDNLLEIPRYGFLGPVERRTDCPVK